MFDKILAKHADRLESKGQVPESLSSARPSFVQRSSRDEVSQTQLMLTKIRSICLKIRAIRERSKPNNIVKLPEFNDPNKNSRRTDYNGVKDVLHDTDYEDNKHQQNGHAIITAYSDY
jgi:hypothetical protein